MRDCTTFYVDGQWIAPAEPRRLEVVNPATEAVAGVISLGSRADVDRAVAAAQRAFEDGLVLVDGKRVVAGMDGGLEAHGAVRLNKGSDFNA